MNKENRIKEVQAVIQSLKEWSEYVNALNECAYSDSMLEQALDKLKKVYEEPFQS